MNPCLPEQLMIRFFEGQLQGASMLCFHDRLDIDGICCAGDMATLKKWCVEVDAYHLTRRYAAEISGKGSPAAANRAQNTGRKRRSGPAKRRSGSRRNPAETLR